ncbi:MAG: transposase [Saprospiraceae bacterium]|nr:transposase [Saprospiraceae bacterium]
MKIGRQKYHRRSTRLKGYDYSKPGFYFVTICTKNRENLFGAISKNHMYLNDAGRVVLNCWLEIPKHYPHVKLHDFIIMPNHIHGIFEIEENQNYHEKPQPSQSMFNQPKHRYQHIIPGSLGSIIRGFEIGVTKWFRTHTDIHTVWQRNFHDTIIRSKWTIRIISRYIINNPKNWNNDEFFK